MGEFETLLLCWPRRQREGDLWRALLHTSCCCSKEKQRGRTASLQEKGQRIREKSYLPLENQKRREERRKKKEVVRESEVVHLLI
jgi:hypothetical protein